MEDKMLNQIKSAVCAALLILLISGGMLWAADFSADITTYAWLTDPDTVGAPRVLLNFNLPEDFSGKTVANAKLLLPVSFMVNDSARANLSVWPLGTAWSPETVGWGTPWNQAGGDVADSSYILFDTDDFSSRVIEIDILSIASAWAQEWYDNHGLLVMLLQPENHSFNLEQPSGWSSGVVAKVEITYED
jgi:hypothetical protein